MDDHSDSAQSVFQSGANSRGRRYSKEAENLRLEAFGEIHRATTLNQKKLPRTKSLRDLSSHFSTLPSGSSARPIPNTSIFKTVEFNVDDEVGSWENESVNNSSLLESFPMTPDMGVKLTGFRRKSKTPFPTALRRLSKLEDSSDDEGDAMTAVLLDPTQVVTRRVQYSAEEGEYKLHTITGKLAYSTTGESVSSSGSSSGSRGRPSFNLKRGRARSGSADKMAVNFAERTPGSSGSRGSSAFIQKILDSFRDQTNISAFRREDSQGTVGPDPDVFFY